MNHRGAFLATASLMVFAVTPLRSEDVRVLEGHTSSVMGIAFSPDGKTLATGGGGGDSSVRLWDITSE